MQSSCKQLESATLALEKQKELNEKLEIDLLSINKENGCRPSGDSEQDVLGALDIGKKPVSRKNNNLATNSPS